jgi:hypothetical protein
MLCIMTGEKGHHKHGYDEQVKAGKPGEKKQRLQRQHAASPS